MPRWTIVAIGLLFLPVFGPAGSTSGQDNQATTVQEAAPVPETIPPAAPASMKDDATGGVAAHGHHECAGGCETCGRTAPSACGAGCGGRFYADWFCGTCDMPPHYPYCPPMHGYYYFRPYNYLHVARQQLFVASWGDDPRAPYKNEIFRRVYTEYKADHAKSP